MELHTFIRLILTANYVYKQRNKAYSDMRFIVNCNVDAIITFRHTPLGLRQSIIIGPGLSTSFKCVSYPFYAYRLSTEACTLCEIKNQI